MTNGGWGDFAKLLMTGPTWIWTAILAATSMRLFLRDTKFATTLGLNAGASQAWVEPVTGAAWILSASFVGFRIFETTQPLVIARQRRLRAKRRDKKISEQFAQLPDAARNIIAETIFTGEATVSIHSNAAHIAAVQLQQCGAGRIFQGTLGPEFQVVSAWRDYARRHAIGESPTEN